uniref:lysoplasmalogenase n=1 Tax=Paramormyrops kingsleyae TaxID=1676925 RepID=A0A3B3Q8J0_9TELE|nr:lysoplasmalogenase-like [Paramormyrops kingsleyae]
MDILETDAYDRRQRRATSVFLFLSLLPFFLSSSAYFYLWIPESSPSVFAAAVKSIPVISLAAVVLCYQGGRSLWGVAGGLLFSAGGDICLIWHEMFIYGLTLFAVAHVLYSAAFLSHRYSPAPCSCTSVFLSIPLWLLGAGVYFYMYPNLQKQEDADVITLAVAGYTLLIVTMATLAVRTHRPSTFLGSLIFMVSDLSLALQVFKMIDQAPAGRAVVMTTYYLAQLLIAVGDVTADGDKGGGLGKRKRM